MTPTPNGNQHVCFKLDVPAVLGSGAYAGIVSVDVVDEKCELKCYRCLANLVWMLIRHC